MCVYVRECVCMHVYVRECACVSERLRVCERRRVWEESEMTLASNSSWLAAADRELAGKRAAGRRIEHSTMQHLRIHPASWQWLYWNISYIEHAVNADSFYIFYRHSKMLCWRQRGVILICFAVQSRIDRLATSSAIWDTEVLWNAWSPSCSMHLPKRFVGYVVVSY